jgi:NAD(P)-dependent dehydrogenase (short-subunit alcohol dehydrogenase family)
VHLKGMFFMAQAVYPTMVARGQGCIINVASQRGLKGAANSAPYSAAKAAIMGFTRALAWEATPKGIRVNAIAPGPVWTPLNPADRRAEQVAKFGSDTAMKRAAQPEEIAPAFVFMAAPSCSSYITGEIFPIVGGYS